MKSTITDDFKRHRLTKQYFEEKEKIQFMSAKKQKKLKAYLSEIMEKLDPDHLEFDMSTIPPPPVFAKQSVYPRGDNVHAQGVNRFIYFVTQNIAVQKPKWVRLPDAEARQLRLSRFFQKKLSGDLTARIWDRIPPFPGVEAHYLRCLIARIKHGAQLAPQPLVKVDDPPEEPDEPELTESQIKEEAQAKLG